MPRLSRRRLLQAGGLAVAGRVVARASSALSMDRTLEAPHPPPRGALPDRPNLLLLITDQERYPQHWPEDWAEAHLPNQTRLMRHGMTFRHAYCTATMCSPSRATLFTGLYAAQHGVTRTLTYGGGASGDECPLSPHLPNLATLLGGAGYRVALAGKWHLSKHADGGPPDAADVAAYGFNEWVPTTAGEAVSPEDFGGGCAANDESIADRAIAFLQAQAPGDAREQPFALVVSLANPHDVLAYPNLWNRETCEDDGYAETADLDQGILLADTPSYVDDLATKPSCQAQSLALYNAMGIIQPPPNLEPRHYVNFYAYLQSLADAQIGRVLDALDAQGLTEETIIVRLSDHGEMGLAHGGLRQKMFNVYEESLRVPLIVSNPTLYPEPLVSDALVSLVDVLPTLGTLLGAPVPEAWGMRGRDLGPVLADPRATVQDELLFTFDDENAGLPETQSIVQQPNHIRCLRLRDADGEWVYARYFDPAGREPDQFEMYHLTDGTGAPVDPDELDNLAHPDSPNYLAMADVREALHRRLLALESERLAPRGRVAVPYVVS